VLVCINYGLECVALCRASLRRSLTGKEASEITQRALSSHPRDATPLVGILLDWVAVSALIAEVEDRKNQ
jgi:hypothetical protein